jgi:hypothetical protein
MRVVRKQGRPRQHQAVQEIRLALTGHSFLSGLLRPAFRQSYRPRARSGRNALPSRRRDLARLHCRLTRGRPPRKARRSSVGDGPSTDLSPPRADFGSVTRSTPPPSSGRWPPSGGLREGWVVEPTVITGISPRERRRRRSIRTDRAGYSVRNRGGGGGARQRHPLRAQRHALHREPEPCIPRGCGSARGNRVGQLLFHPRPQGTHLAEPAIRASVGRAATSAASSLQNPRQW